MKTFFIGKRVIQVYWPKLKFGPLIYEFAFKTCFAARKYKTGPDTTGWGWGFEIFGFGLGTGPTWISDAKIEPDGNHAPRAKE